MILVAAAAAHLAVLQAVVPWTSLGTDAPFHFDDFALHYGRGAILSEALLETGRLWAYDPSLMAGYPLGATVFDLDNVGTGIAMAVFSGLGPATGFKLFVWLCFAGAPWVIGLAARRLGLTVSEAALATLPAIAIAATNVSFRYGMFANFTACYLVVWVVARAQSFLARPGWRSGFALVALGGAGVALHVFVGILALVPCGLLVFLYARTHPRRTLAAASGVTLALVAVNSFWLVPYLRFAPVIGWDYPHDFLQTGDFDQVIRSLRPVWALVPYLLLLGGVGFVSWARRVDRNLAIAYGVWVIVLLAVGLQGSQVEFLRRIEPAHMLVPLSFALCPLAGVGAHRIATACLRGIRAHGPLAMVVAALLFVPHLGYALVAVRWLPPIPAAYSPQAREFFSWIERHTDKSARVAIEDRSHRGPAPSIPGFLSHHLFTGHMAAAIPRIVDREVIGGPYAEMPIEPHRADLASGRFFGQPIGDWDDRAFGEQLALYNIGWLAVWSDPSHAYLDRHPDLEHVDSLGPFRLYRSPHPHSFALEGSAEIRARTNAIEVRAARGERLVLKYHWYPGFCSNPPLPVIAFEQPELAAPFIAVEMGNTRDFTLHPTRGPLGSCP